MAIAAKQVSCVAMMPDAAKLLDHIAELERRLKAEHAARIASEERAAIAESRASGLEAEVETLKLTIAKLRRDKFGASSERGARLIDQLELQLAELEERIAQDQAAADIAAPPLNEQNAAGGREQSRKPARRPLPEHLPRERIVHPAPSACPCCGGPLRKLGEDITETLEHVPAQWKVIQHVREKFSCRKCEAITQPPAHRTPSPAAAPGRSCWLKFCLASTGRICRSTGRARSTPRRASTSMSRRWPTGSAPARPR
jgi:transposase